MRVVGGLFMVVALGVAGCGQLDPPAQRLADAPARTAAADTARMALESSTQMGEATGARMDFTITGEGQVDFAAEQVQLSVTMPGPMPGDMEMVVDGDDVYLRMPFLDEEQWMRADAAGAPTDLLQGGTAGDPTEALTALGAVNGEIDELGTEEIRGATARGYAFEVPASEVVPVNEELDGLSEVTVAMEAWLDDEGRARRLSHTMDLAEVMAAVQRDSDVPDDMGPDLDLGDIVGEQTTVVEFFDFGEPVDITVPDEDQVEEVPAFQDGFEESVQESIEAEAGTSMPAPPAEGDALPPAEPRAEPAPVPPPAPSLDTRD